MSQTRPSTSHNSGLVDCWVFLLMIMIEVYIVIIPYTFLHITMVDYKLSTKGPLKNLFQEVNEEEIFKTVIKAVSNIHINTILIIIIIV